MGVNKGFKVYIERSKGMIKVNPFSSSILDGLSTKKGPYSHSFHQLGPLGQVGLVVTMSVCCHLLVYPLPVRRGGGHKRFFQPPVPAKPNILYIRGKFVDMVCWTVG